MHGNRGMVRHAGTGWKALGRIAAAFIVTGSLLGIAGPAAGALLAYDGFDYAPVGSDLNGNNGGFGFTSAWVPGGFNASSFNHLDIGAGSLAFNGLATGGNRASTGPLNEIGGLTRSLAQPLGAAGSTVYLSLLLRPEGTVGGGIFGGFFGLVLESAGEPELFIGKPGGGAINQYVAEARGGGSQVSTGVNAVVDETVFLVLAAEFSAGNDEFTLYVNPDPGGPEPAAGTVLSSLDVGMIGGLTIYSTGAFSIDEIRIGNTFADVTPGAAVPVPATLALLGLGIGVLGFARRRA